jgi:hypothetical protein
MRRWTISCIVSVTQVREVILSWGRNSFNIRTAVVAVLLVTASAAAADILVVRSVGPSAKGFAPGKRIPQGTRIVLKANDRLDVLDGRGTRTLRGPGSFVAGAATGAVASAGAVNGQRARIGAVRGVGGGELRPPSIWHVDVTKSSTICIAQPSGVTLGRANSTPAVTARIDRLPGGGTRQLAWEAGSSTIAWPTDLPIADGAEYRLSIPGAATPTSLRFRTLPQRPVGLEDLASFLISNQCQVQLDMFIETVRIPDNSPPAG